jgi:hypothetical protein
MKKLAALPGAPESRTVTRGSVDDGLFPLLSRKSDVSELEGLNRRNIANKPRMQRESPFNAPPFVTLQERNSNPLKLDKLCWIILLFLFELSVLRI